ncbi:MAG: hypothetical protein WC686_05895, partial [Candidatus Shapirobacteria bacterium]
MKKIAQDFVKGLAKIGGETGREMINEAGKIGGSVISGEELLGLAAPPSESELAKIKLDDDRKKQEEMAELRAKMKQGRDVEKEMEEVRVKREQSQQQEKQEEARRAEENRRWQAANQEMAEDSSNPHKAKKKRGSAFL